MFNRLSLALAGVAVIALVLFFALPLLFGDGSGPLAPLPLLAAQSELAGDFQVGRPLGPLGDVELVLEADLPEGPTEAPVYRQAGDALPAAPEEALAWAERFNLPNPQVYRDVRDPGSLIVIASDGQTLSFNAKAPTAISYGLGVDPLLEWRPDDLDTPPPLSFEAARDVAIGFLQTHDLLPDAYQVEEEGEIAPPDVQASPIRQVLIRPLLDGYPVEGHEAEIRVMVGPDGTAYSAWLSPLKFARGETYPLRSAQAAFEALRTGDVKGPFRLSIDWHAPPEAVTEATQTTTYRPEPATYQAGDAATVRGSVQLLRAVATDEIRASLFNSDGTFELAGQALEEMAAEVGYNEVVVQGTIQAELGPRRWRLAVTNWAIELPARIECFVGTIAVEDDIAFLVTDGGTRYCLLAPPEGLSAGDQAAVYAEVVPAEGDKPPALRWFGIESPPAAQQYVSGSSESVSVVVEREVLEAAPGSTPVEQVIVGTLHFEDGDPVLETPEGQRFRVVGLPDELPVLPGNDGRDGRVIAVRGQVTPPAGVGGLPTLVWVAQEPVPEPAELHQETEMVIQPVEVEKEVIGGGSMEVMLPVRPEPGFEPPQSPYEVGEEVEIEGMVGAVIYTDGTHRKVKAWLRAGLGPEYELDYQLSGSPKMLEELAQCDRLHLRVKGRIVAEGEYPQGQTLEVKGFEKIWPNEKLQGYLGTISIETLEGREVAVFTDEEAGQRYVLFQSLTPHFTQDQYQWSHQHKHIYLEGVERPDQTFASLPMIEVAGTRAGSRVDAATSADQLPLEHPQVIDERTMPKRIKGKAIIDRVELAYYAPPAPVRYPPSATVFDRMGNPVQTATPSQAPEWLYVQSVWVFHGHSEDGLATFRAYVQAVADDYLQ